LLLFHPSYFDVMAEFQQLPEHIRKAVIEHTSPDEQVRMCFVAGLSMFSSKDYVIITSKRVLVIDERYLGYLGKSYVNIKENVPIEEIVSIEIIKSFTNKILGQASMGLQVDRYKYLINNGGSGEIKKAAKLIGEIKQTLSQEAK